MSLQQGWPKRFDGQIVHEGPGGSGVFINGIERKDFTTHWDDAGQQIIFESLTYDEACNVVIKPR